MARIDIKDFLSKDNAQYFQHVADDVRDMLLLELELVNFAKVRPDDLRDILEDLCKAYRSVLDHDWQTLDHGARTRRHNWCAATTRRLGDLMLHLKRTPEDVPGLDAFHALEMRILAFMAKSENLAR